ncbi:MAG: hypothetical protein AAF512_11920 [Pseudomonadota bacterium]
MKTDTPIYPHGDIEEIANDVFMVRGSIKMNPVVRITRNMAIIRHGGELSLINPIRLDARGETQLATLGKVSHVIRTGSLHGVDDPDYIDKFNAQMWAQAGGTTYPEPSIDVELSVSASLPFNNVQLFEFNGTLHPECALLFKDSKLLLTCDAIQNYGDYSYNNLLARLMMPWIGFPKTTIVGPVWLKLMTPEGGTLEPVFRQLLELDFDRLLSAHGTFLASGAKEAVQTAVDKAFS